MSSISGVVVDEYGETMPGVAVYDPADMSGGTLTSNDGRYSIIVSKKCTELEFSFLGYKIVRLPLAKTALVKMEPDTETIEETVVTGIFTRKTESFTGAVQSVAADELKRAGNQNVFESLKNLDPSLMVFDNLSQGSNPNAVASMQLRGASSFDMGTTDIKNTAANDPNMPLFILDGFETTAEKVQDMDMNRVESITILKDASAKAIYGSKAGNGVIVIETKSLRSDQTAVTYTGNVTVDIPDLSSYNLCNALEKLDIEWRDGYYDDISTGSTTGMVESYNLYNQRLKKALEGESTYWLSKPLRTGISQKHSLGVELGSKALKAFVTFSYNNTQGAMKGSYREVISGDVNLSYRVNKWQFRNVMSVSNMRSEESPYGDFSSYSLMNPYLNPYDSDGNLVKTFRQYVGGVTAITANPLYDATINTKDYSGYLSFTDNLYAEYQVFKPLKLVARLGISTQRSDAELFYPADHSKFTSTTGAEDTEDTILSKGSFQATNSMYTTFSGDISAQFNHSIGKKHDIFATAQYTVSQTSQNSVTHYAEGFPNSRMNNITFARQYATDSTPTGYDSINRNLGLLLTAGYSYMDRYMLDATIKGSASSVFGTNNRWGTFWSTGVAWNLHHENFMSGASWLKMLKIRASLGSSGNQNFMSNTSLPVYQYYNNAYYNGFTGAYVTNMENPDLGWEQKMDYNVGLDFRTNAISLTFDAYVADTENLVFNRSILPSTGFSNVSDNLGRVRNKGLEAGLTYRVWQRGSSYVALMGRIAMNDNRILEISDVLRNYNQQQIKNAAANGSVDPVIQYYDGMPLHSIWVVPSLGIDPVSGDEIFVDKNGNMVNVWNASDLVNYGSSDPLYNGNFGINGEIKGVGFSFICTYYGGGYMYNTTLLNKVENTGLSTNLDKRIFEGRWYKEGQNAVFRNGEDSPTQATSRFVQKNNVLSLSSASIYYEFPYMLIRKAKLSRLRLSLYANDLATFSSIEIERGTSYPYAKSFSFSLTATF